MGFLQTEEQKILSDAKSNCPTFYNLSLKTSCKTSTKATMRHAPPFKRNQREKKQSGHIWKVFQVHVNPGQGAVREPILIELVIINQLLIHFKSISKY